MISYNEAISIILYEETKPLGSELISLLDSRKRVLAEDIRSCISIPYFNNSAMDGFAISSRETDFLKEFQIKETITAGSQGIFFGPRTAVRIMTGAPIPDGRYDSVIPVEETETFRKNGEEFLLIKKKIEKGLNIRLAGEDFKKNSLVLSAHKKIDSYHIMALSSLGYNKVLVKCNPKVVILSTGNEIIDSFTNENKIQKNKIFNCNSPYLIASLKEYGIGMESIKYIGIVADDEILLEKKIISILDDKYFSPDLIISTGSISMGELDILPKVLKKIGAKINFHKVKIKPGKPILFSKIRNIPFFSLPGNPVSTIVGYKFFVEPLINKILSVSQNKPIKAKLKSEFKKKNQFRYFLKAFNSIDDNDSCNQVEILHGQESFKISPLLKANCWAILDEECSILNPGDIIQIILD